MPSLCREKLDTSRVFLLRASPSFAPNARTTIASSVPYMVEKAEKANRLEFEREIARLCEGAPKGGARVSEATRAPRAMRLVSAPEIRLKVLSDTREGLRMRTWKMSAQCEDCPFATKGKGLHLRKSLRPARWRSILYGLRHNESFTCHKTAEETGDGSNLVCAGAMEWQEAHGVSANYVRVMERIEGMAKAGKFK